MLQSVVSQRVRENSIPVFVKLKDPQIFGEQCGDSLRNWKYDSFLKKLPYDTEI